MSLTSLKVAELKSKCNEMGLIQTGTKPQILLRLSQALAARSAADSKIADAKHPTGPARKAKTALDATSPQAKAKRAQEEMAVNLKADAKRVQEEAAKKAQLEAKRAQEEAVKQAKLEAYRVQDEVAKKVQLEAGRVQDEAAEKAQLEAKRSQEEVARSVAETQRRSTQQVAAVHAVRLKSEEERARKEAQRANVVKMAMDPKRVKIDLNKKNPISAATQAQIVEWFNSISGGEASTSPEQTMQLCEDLNIDVEGVEALVLSFVLRSPTMGVFGRQEFLTGASCFGIRSFQELKSKLPGIVVNAKWNGELFDEVYKFVYDWACDPGQRIASKDLVIGLWRLLVPVPAFPQLERWIEFLEKNQKMTGVTKDVWLLFRRWLVLGGLQNRDESQAWPLIIDDFIEELRR